MHIVFNGLRCVNKYVTWMMKIGAVDVACDDILMMLVTIWWIVLLYFTVKKLLLKMHKRFDDVVVSTAPDNYITMLKN